MHKECKLTSTRAIQRKSFIKTYLASFFLYGALYGANVSEAYASSQKNRNISTALVGCFFMPFFQTNKNNQKIIKKYQTTREI